MRREEEICFQIGRQRAAIEMETAIQFGNAEQRRNQWLVLQVMGASFLATQGLNLMRQEGYTKARALEALASALLDELDFLENLPPNELKYHPFQEGPAQ